MVCGGMVYGVGGMLCLKAKAQEKHVPTEEQVRWCGMCVFG